MNPRPPPVSGVKSRRGAVEDLDFSLGRCQVAGQDTHQGAFASPGRTDEAEDLTLPHGQVYAFQYPVLAEVLNEPLYLDEPHQVFFRPIKSRAATREITKITANPTRSVAAGHWPRIITSCNARMP